MNVNDQNNWGVVETASNFNLIINHLLKNMTKEELITIKKFLEPELDQAARNLAFSTLKGHEFGKDTYANLLHAVDRLEVMINLK